MDRKKRENNTVTIMNTGGMDARNVKSTVWEKISFKKNISLIKAGKNRSLLLSNHS